MRSRVKELFDAGIADYVHKMEANMHHENIVTADIKTVVHGSVSFSEHAMASGGLMAIDEEWRFVLLVLQYFGGMMQLLNYRPVELADFNNRVTCSSCLSDQLELHFETSRLMSPPPPPQSQSQSTPREAARRSPQQRVLPARRRSTWRFVRALLWKNWVLKRRRYVATLLEIAFPTAFILLMGYLKTLTDDVAVPTGWSDASPSDASAQSSMDTSSSAITPGSTYNLYTPYGGSLLPWVLAELPKFNMHESTLTGLLLALGQQSMLADDGTSSLVQDLPASQIQECVQGVAVYGAVSTNRSSPHRVPEACGGKVSPYKLAIAPDTTFTRQYFLQTMELWYPRVNFLDSSISLQAPSFKESVVFYKTAEALEAYIQSSKYGDGLENPRVYGAIVFDTFPESVDEIGTFSSIEYTLRLNSTLGKRGTQGRVPRTIGNPPAISPFQRDINVNHYSRYAVTGFMTLQTLVTRFVSCMPEWDVRTNTTTGICQRPHTTAVSSPELDDRLLATLNNDALIQASLTALSGGPSTKVADFRLENLVDAAYLPFSSILGFMSSDAKEALLKPLRQAPQPYLGASVTPFPVESYTSSPFYSDVKNVFAIIFILAYLYAISRILVVFVEEKESRMREFMKILGVEEKAIVISWYITYTGILMVGSVLQTYAGTFGLFANSSVIIVFLFFFLFSMSVLAYGFLVSTIFSRARAGAFVGMVVFFLMYFLSAAFKAETSQDAKKFGCILSPVALTLGVRVLSDLESTGQGISFSNIDVETENFRFSTALWAFLFDTILYTLLGLYLEKVIPKDYGTTLKWTFPFSPSYWLKTGHHSMTQDPSYLKESLLANVVLDVNSNFEPVNGELREQERNGSALSVQRLRKV
ncbi:Abc transporter a family member 1, partial [Globisporangium polare]